MENSDETDLDLGDDLVIKKQIRRTSAGGTWVVGTLHGHKFDALVFPEHAECADYEIDGNGEDGSKISKLWIQRMSDKKTTYNWDRGIDIPAADFTTESIVAYLCAGLADYVYAFAE